MTINTKDLNQLENILKFAQEVDKSKLHSNAKNALIFNEQISQKADTILDKIGFCPKDCLTSKHTVKDFCKNLQLNLEVLNKGSLRSVLEKKDSLFGHNN